MKESVAVARKRSSSRSTSLSVLSEEPKTKRASVSRRVVSESDGSSTITQSSVASSTSEASLETIEEEEPVSTNDSKLNLLLGKCRISSHELACLECGQVFEKALHLHTHLASEHLSDTVLCSHCGRTSSYLHRNHVCSVCNKFFAHLAEHELTHFRDKTGRHALMECPKCYRSYPNVFDLKQHCLQAHGQRSGRQFGCFGCSERFPSRHIRDHHFVSHIQTVVDNVMDNVENIQNQMGQLLQNNQCPICHYAMSSRKSFRFHLIYRHILTDLKEMQSLLGAESYDKDEMKLVMKIIHLGGSPHTLNGSFDCDEHGNPLVPRKRGRRPKQPVLPPVIFPEIAINNDKMDVTVKEEAIDSGCDMSGGESPLANNDHQEPHQVKMEPIDDSPVNDSPEEEISEPWVALRNKLVQRCLRKSEAADFECSACEKSFPRMYNFELHLISDHIGLALES